VCSRVFCVFTCVLCVEICFVFTCECVCVCVYVLVPVSVPENDVAWFIFYL
jgi:hypothetical protein